MVYHDLWNIREELVVFLRNSDIFTTNVRGVVTYADNLTGDGTATLTLTKTGVRNVRSVTVNAVTQTFGTDYTITYNPTATSTITFTNAPGVGVAVVVNYDHGPSDKIYADFPRDDLTMSSFPRIGVDVLSAKSQMVGFGNVVNTDFLITVVVYDHKTKDISGYITTIRQKFIAAFKSFYYLKLVVPNGIGPVVVSPNKNDKVFSQAVDFNAQFNLEKN